MRRHCYLVHVCGLALVGASTKHGRMVSLLALGSSIVGLGLEVDKTRCRMVLETNSRSSGMVVKVFFHAWNGGTTSILCIYAKTSILTSCELVREEIEDRRDRGV